MVERVGVACVIRTAGDDTGLRALAHLLPAVPAPLVVDTATPAVLDRLARVVGSAARRGGRTLRVVAPAGFPDLDLAWWQRLAERTGVELLVPSGPVAVAGGTLFARGAREDSTGTWWRFAPRRPAESLGPRHPPPRWQVTAPGAPPRAHGLLVTEHVPGGVVLRPPTSASDPSWASVPPDPDHLVVVAGVPGGPRVRAADVAACLGALPEAARAAVKLGCADGQDVVELGLLVAGFLGVGVTVVDGVPHVRDGEVRFVFRDTVGAPTWTPYLQEVHCPAGGTAVVPVRWRTPSPRLVPHLPGVFRVDDHWLVLVMRSGLWVRSAHRPPQPVPAGRAVDPSVLTIAVGDPGEPLPGTVWPVVRDLLDDLEPPSRDRARLSVLGVPDRGGRRVAEALAGSRRVGLRLHARDGAPRR
ncbi:hypothetical protein ACQPYE_17280 [Actinosynnema sp. CA-299493]